MQALLFDLIQVHIEIKARINCLIKAERTILIASQLVQNDIYSHMSEARLITIPSMTRQASSFIMDGQSEAQK